MPSTSGVFSFSLWLKTLMTGPVGVTVAVAATGGVGSVSINGDADAVVTGLQATASMGQVLIFNDWQ